MTGAFRRGLDRGTRIVALALLYYGAARLGLAQGYLPGNVAPIWPPTGVAIAALVLLGRSAWPGVAIGALLVNGLGPIPFPAAAGMAAGNTMEAVAGAWLLRRFRFSPGFDRLRDVAVLVISVLAAAAISASAGVASLRAGGVTDPAGVSTAWRVWWAGDVLGALVVGGLALAWAGRPRRRPRLRAEVMLLAAGIPATAVALTHTAIGPYPLFAPVVWAAIRYRARGATLATFAVAAVVVATTVRGLGPYAIGSTVHRLFLVDAFVGALAITGLVVAAITGERDRALESTERQVEERTRELVRDRERLARANDTAQRLAGVVRSSNDAIYTKNLAGRILEWNPAAERIYGWPAREIVGRDVSVLLPGGGEELAETMRRIRSGERVDPYETVRVRKDGRLVDVAVTVSPIRDAGGRIAGASTISRDVTAQKSAELALRQSEERFRLSFENASTGMALVAVDGRFLRVNPALCDIVGYPADALLRTSFQAITHPDDLHADLEYLRRILAGEIPTYSTEKRYLHADGHAVWIHLAVSLARDDDGRPLHFISQITDITASRRAEQRFASLVESAPDAMVIVGSDGRLLVVNRQTEVLFGYRREELIGQPVEILLPEALGERHRAHRRRYSADPHARPMGSGMELNARRSDGTEVAVEVSLGPLPTEEGTVVAAAIRDITSRREAAAALAHAAMHDALTGLPNRVLLADRLEQALTRSGRSGEPVAVLFFDLDRFKLINDSLGHAAGDQVLVAVTERLLGTVRSEDTVARFGGDEFVVVTTQHAGAAPAAGLAERISDVLRQPIAVDGGEVFVSASIGIALGRGGEATGEGLLRDADAAMYRAKDRGRARVEFFDAPMRSEAAGRLQTQNALHRALDRGEMRVFYQPVVELASSRIVGAEALIRWQHPEQGLLLPSAFVAVAEEAGLIVPIGQWLIDEAARQCAEWRDRGLFVSVNLSPRQLRQPDLVRVLHRAVGANSLPPGALRLELTESMLMEDLELHGRTLAAIRDLGVTLAIDDFGTGYSSLTYLRRFPVSMVKIDRTFVAGLGRNPADAAIVDGVISLAHALELEVVAEGAETLEQVDCLRDLRCDKVQGFYFAAPAPPEAIAAMLGTGGSRAAVGAASA